MPRPVARKPGRCGALLALLLLHAPPLWAEPAPNPVCDFVRITLSLDEYSRQILIANQPADRAQAIRELERRLHGIAGYASRLAESGTDQGAFTLIADFLESRLDLIAAVRSRGVNAAQARMLSPGYVQRAQRLQQVLAGRPDCGPQDKQGTWRSDANGRPSQPIAEHARRNAAPHVIERAEPMPLLHGVGYATLALALVALALGGLKLLAYWDLRGDRRYTCSVPTQLHVGGFEQAVQIKDISRSGAKLQGQNQLAPGDRAALLLGQDLRTVRVVWANPNFVGVVFKRRLESSPRTLLVGAPTLR